MMEKKLMQSRSRKYRKSSQNYQSAIQKQLNDDFQVFDYLNQNKLEGNNIDDYLKLFNCLQVVKNNKKKKYQALEVNYLQMSADIFQKSMLSSEQQVWKAQKDQFLFQHEQILMKTANEEQVKNNLDEQIIQTMKTLNLLKGDIGHLVSRNQSAQLLSSKITKVKIVADDQLKRVSMAHLKDKDQLKLRGQMQKSFNSKLQNVSLFEDSSLASLKKKYLTAMVRKKEIHNKLNYIEKVRNSINRSEDRQQQKNQINRKSLQSYRYFVKVRNLIESVAVVCKNMGNSSQQIIKFVQWLKEQQNYKDNIGYQQSTLSRTGFSRCQSHKKTMPPPEYPIDCLNSSDLQIITEENLNKISQLIQQQHFYLSQQIQNQIQYYNIQMKRNKQLVGLLEKYDLEIQDIQTDFVRENNLMYLVKKQDREDFNFKLRQFIQFLKTIFTLLEYVEKNLNYSNQAIETQQKMHKQMGKRQTKLGLDRSRVQESNQRISSQRSLISTNKSYISQLYKTYYILLKDQSEDKLDTIQNTIYLNLKQDIESWLLIIKNSFIQGKINRQCFELSSKLNQNYVKTSPSNLKYRQSMHLIKNNKFSPHEQQDSKQIKDERQLQTTPYCHRLSTMHFQSRQSTLKNRVQPLHKIASISLHNRNKRQVQKVSTKRSNQIKSNSNSISTNLININKLIQQPKQAQRIRFLKDLDKDYYKMLKSTLVMEKQNTRKNYQFLRTFKRAKYSSRDQILQEKRFECSFSMLFAGKTNQFADLANKIKQTNNKERKSNELKVIQSSRSFRSTSSLIGDKSQRSFKQMKQNAKKLKDKTNIQKNIQKKQSLSIQMKEVINLV